MFFPPFGRTPLAAALLAATLSLAAQPSAEGPVTLTFQVDARALEGPGMPGPETIGLRGSAPPLSWDRSVPMSDPRGNGGGADEVLFVLARHLLRAER